MPEELLALDGLVPDEVPLAGDEAAPEGLPPLAEAAVTGEPPVAPSDAGFVVVPSGAATVSEAASLSDKLDFPPHAVTIATPIENMKTFFARVISRPPGAISKAD
jgi:hypothetical protein